MAGLLVYGFAANPKAAEIGRLVFFAGVFVTLLAFGLERVHLP